MAEQVLDEMLGVLGAEDLEVVNTRLDKKRTSHVRMAAQEAVVLAKGVFRAREHEPTGGNRELFNRLGLGRAAFELPGNTLVDVGMERVSTISIHCNPASPALPVQPFEDLCRVALEPAFKVSWKRTGIE